MTLPIPEMTEEEWLAWHAVDDQLNLILFRHGVELRTVDRVPFRKAVKEYRMAVIHACARTSAV